MAKIILGTTNPAKKKELAAAFSGLIEAGVELLFPTDLGITADVEEAGATFEENSLLKAKYYAKLAQLPAIGDDGGIEIDYLNGEPGVKSKRWLGRDATDEELIEYTLERLRDVPTGKRGAKMTLVLTFYDPATGTILSAKESVQGHIAEKPSPRRNDGFPFRSLFIVDEYDKYYDELSHEEHENINHRVRAARQLSTKLRSFMLQ
jgi:non-canonical purine NTP pyrophosphatase (RdgB/HAM1 family)